MRFGLTLFMVLLVVSATVQGQSDKATGARSDCVEWARGLSDRKVGSAEMVALDSCIISGRKLGSSAELSELLLIRAAQKDRSGDPVAALKGAEEALNMARDVKSPPRIIAAAELLGELYGRDGKWEQSFSMTQLAATLRSSASRTMPGAGPSSMGGSAVSKDKSIPNAFATQRLFEQMLDSVRNETTKRLMEKAEMERQFSMKALADSLEFVRKSETMALEVARKEADLKRQRIVLLSAGVVLILLLVMAVVVYRGKKRSDGLLLNILPKETERHGSAQARHFDTVTVLFTDFKRFTSLSEQMSPQLLVEEINDCFSAFDRIIEKHGLEKIKTIGDSYMAAGGLPVPNTTHAEDAVRAALEICEHMEHSTREKRAKGLPFFEVRIGIHTGPVVEGIVGIKKFQYDIWGDTVNTASRMESAGEAGKVIISESTFERVKDRFNCLFRGEVEVKGKGAVRMYFVDGVHDAPHA